MPVLRAAVSLSVLAASAAAGVVIRVPQDFPTIQEAVDTALAGDTVQISAGDYPDGVDLESLTDITLRGKGDVVVHVQGAVPAVKVNACSGIQLIGLHVTGGTGNGIEVTDSSGVTVQKCRFDTLLSDGLHATGCAALSCIACQANNVTGAAFSFSPVGTDTPCDDLLVQKCKTTLCTTGLVVRGDAPRLEKNSITQPVQSGISLIDVTAGVVTKNKVQGLIGGIAIRVATTSAETEITRNKLDGSGTGLDLTDSQHVNLRKNNIVISDFGCVMTTCSNCLGEKNRILCGDAWVAQGCDHIQLTANKLVSDVTGPGPGISFTFSNDCTALNNKLKGQTTGFNLGGDRDTVQGGLVAKAINGVGMDSTITQATVTGLKLKACTGQGIVVDGSGASVSGCKISKPGGDGLDVFGSGASITGNVVSKAGGSGVHLQAAAAGNTLSANKAKGSADFDLLDESGGANTVDPDNSFKTHSP